MIRSFRQSDMEPIMEIWLAGNLQAHSFIPESYWRSNWEAVRGQIPEAEICVWEEDGAVLGFIGLTDGYVAGLFTAATGYLVNSILARFISSKIAVIVAIAAALVVDAVTLFAFRVVTLEDVRKLPKGEKIAKALAKRGWIR